MPRTLVLAACLSALPALAFEGVIDMKMTITGKPPEAKQPVSSTGNITVTIKGLNSRMDSTMTMPGVSTPLKTTVIHRADDPNTTYLVYEATKTYQKQDSKADVDRDESKSTVKRLGKETIAGRTTEHVLVTHQGDNREMELWVDTNLISSADLERAFSAGNQSGSGSWWGALKKAGVAGVPLKTVSKGKDAYDRVTTEATRVESRSVSSSLFQVPAGYTESKDGMGAISAEQQKEMMKSYLDKLSPQERQKVEEMMKKQAGGH